MSHYEFPKAIVLAKICPQEYSAPKQRESIPFQRGDHRGQRRSSSSVRSLAMCDAMSASTARAVTATRAKKAKTASAYVTAVQVKDRSSVLHGKRLNPVLSHLPSPVVRAGDACTLCRWATGNKYRAQISHCDDCNVTLCVWCYKTFHTVEDLEAQKGAMCVEILARKEPTARPQQSTRMRKKAAAEKRKSNNK